MSLFINYPHRRRTVPLRVLVPNLITTASLCSGLASIQYSLHEEWDRAMFAIVLAAVLDGLDGRAARLLKVSSPFGEVLDSLADFLSFGVAPAALIHLWMFTKVEPKAAVGAASSVLEGSPRFEPYIPGMLAVVLFVLCSAFRLARFTAAAQVKPAPRTAAVERAPDGELAHEGRSGASRPALTPDQQREVAVKARFFVGLATPAAAAAALIPPMLSFSKFTKPVLAPMLGFDDGVARPIGAIQPSRMAALVVAGYMIVIALWMVSRVPMFSFKKVRVSRRAVVPILVCVGLLAVLAVADLWLLLPVLTAVYLLTGPLSVLSHRRLMTGRGGGVEVRGRAQVG
jgi:CDP-diacylglycerol--serine O-phosphatidyltransferase